jgi:hypothetical protein
MEETFSSQGRAQSPIAANQILPVTRILAAIIVPILTAAFIMLFLFPNDSGLLFAWPIAPTMSAMMLGATYLGGAYFFTRVVLSREWHAIQLGLIPVSAFAGILGIATLLHWDRFTHGHISFILWAFLYFTLPFVIAAVWLINRRTAPGGASTREPKFSFPLRLALAAVGAVMAAASLMLLIAPQAMIPLWPWTLTPLTARVLAAMFILPGLVGMGVARDGRWSAARIIFQAQVVSIVLFLVGMLRASTEIQWSSWGIWTFLGGLLLVLVLIGLAARQAGRAASSAASESLS